MREAIKLTIPVEPMGTVRMTSGMVKRIKWYGANDPKAEKVKRYLNYKEAISLYVKAVYRDKPIDKPVHVNIAFHLPIPESWSGKKRREADGQLHTSKPDRDNLEKGVLDSLNKIIWLDDKQVCSGSSIKRYSSKPRIEIEIHEVC